MAASKTKKVEAKTEAVTNATMSTAQRRMAERYKKEEMVDVNISPLYRNEFSNNMPVSLNGVRVNVPVDGKTYKLPKSFAMEVRRRIYVADQKTKRLDKMADVKSNVERSPGELKLFR